MFYEVYLKYAAGIFVHGRSSARYSTAGYLRWYSIGHSGILIRYSTALHKALYKKYSVAYF